jgi:glycosyltransferase involved in cell wall biosynthesis
MVICDYIPNQDLPYIFSGALQFLYPSLRESFGIPILESMACGTPVITSNTSAMPEIAGDAALLVDPYSPEAIAEGILKIETDENLRKELINSGNERIKFFSWEKTATELLKIYKNIVNHEMV